MPDQCLLPACERGAYSRGLCRGCYCAAQRRIKDGRVTWEQLQEWKLAGPVRRSRNPMAVALDKLQEETNGGQP